MPTLLDWIGYSASLIILVSLLMSSIKKLRWINLFGAILFSIYGFQIASLPTGLMNAGIAIIDIYYLWKMYRIREYFKIIQIQEASTYLKTFLDFNSEDIKRFNKDITNDQIQSAKIKLYTLRNLTPAGLFVCEEYDSKSLHIVLDYVIPAYRDFKIGNFVFENQRDHFITMGYERFVTETSNKDHIKYLLRMGFEKITENNKEVYIKKIK